MIIKLGIIKKEINKKIENRKRKMEKKNEKKDLQLWVEESSRLIIESLRKIPLNNWNHSFNYFFDTKITIKGFSAKNFEK